MLAPHPNPSRRPAAQASLDRDSRHRRAAAISAGKLVFVLGDEFGRFAPATIAKLLTNELNLVPHYDFAILEGSDIDPFAGHIYLNRKPLTDTDTNAPYAFTRAQIPQTICNIQRLIKAGVFHPRLR